MVDALQATSTLVFPKPPTPPPITTVDETASVPVLDDPPPPYPNRERRPRTGTTRGSRRLTLISTDNDGRTQPQSLHRDVASPTDDDTEITPLLSPHRRRRTISHSTVASAHSIAQTVLSLFQAEAAEAEAFVVQDGSSGDAQDKDLTLRLRRYFRPLHRKSYYKALFHLTVINFPFALMAFVLLFVGTLVSISFPGCVGCALLGRCIYRNRLR